jgi:hypothetical protein
MNQEIGRRTGSASINANADSVRKIVEDLCKQAGASVAVEDRVDPGDENQTAPRAYVHITYNGEKPMPYPNWWKLVDTIDEALDASGLIDWESSALSAENEEERMATWGIAGPDGETAQ